MLSLSFVVIQEYTKDIPLRYLHNFTPLTMIYRCVPGRTSLTQRDVLPGTHRFSLDTYFNSSPIHHLFDLFVEIL